MRVRRALAVAAVLLPVACAQRGGSERYTNFIVPEPLEVAGSSAERELDVLIGEYEENRKSLDRRDLFYTQERFRRLGEENSRTKVGELAHLYVAKIYFQAEDYHDCIRTLDDFLRDHPRSEWRAAAEGLRHQAEAEVARYRAWRSSLGTQTLGSDTETE